MRKLKLTRRKTFAIGGLLLGLFATPIFVNAQSIVAILTCPMGCGVMEGNTIFGTMMAKAGEKLIVASQNSLNVQSNINDSLDCVLSYVEIS